MYDAVAFPPLDNRPDTNRSSGPLGTVSGQRASVRVQSHDGSLFHTSSVASVASGGGPNQSSARHRRTFRSVLRNLKVNAHYQRKQRQCVLECSIFFFKQKTAYEVET